MKVRIDEQAYYHHTEATISLRYRQQKADGTGAEYVTLAHLSAQKLSPVGANGDTVPSITQWTDVEFILNAKAQVGIYRIGGAEGTFTFTPNGSVLGILFRADSNMSGLYIDDLYIGEGMPQMIRKNYTASVSWDDANDYAGIRPDSVRLTVGGKSAEVSESTGWQATFKLPAFDKDGNEILYAAGASVKNYVSATQGLQVTLTHEPVLPNTNKSGASQTAIFYNDFEGYLGNDGKVLAEPYNHFYLGASVSQSDEAMYIANDGSNSYLYTKITSTLGTASYQANFTGYTGGDYTVHFRLSTDTDKVPAETYFQYRFSGSSEVSASRKTIFKLSNADGYGYITASGINFNASSQRISVGKWVDVHAVFRMSEDGKSDTCQLYINGELMTEITLPERNPSYKSPYVRIYIPGKNNMDRTLLLDDFVVYPGTELLTVQDLNSPGYYYREAAYEVPDVAAEEQWTKAGATYDPDVLAQAVNSYDRAWPDTRANNYDSMTSAIALYYMVLTENTNPGVISDGKAVAVEAASRIRSLISGGREPWASCGCYWGHGVVATTMTLAKNTPTIWSQLTDREIEKIDLLMECLAIAANWGYNENNNYITGLDLSGNYGKDYNPNYKNAYFTCYLSAAMYFDTDGNHDGNELDEIFVNFNYDSYIQRLKAAGFTNILFTWTTVETKTGKSIGEYMTNGGNVTLNLTSEANTAQQAGQAAGSGVGVKVPFTYKDMENTTVYDSTMITEMFIDAVKYTYSWAVTSSHNSPDSDTYAYILSGVTSPWQGQMGMMREFASAERSKVTYCYLSAVNMAPLYANMKLLGYWDYSDEDLMLKMDNRIYVGTEDLFFKMAEGYMSYANEASGAEYESGFGTAKGGIYIKDIFMNFHFKKNQDITMATTEKDYVLEQPAQVDPAYTPAADSIYASGNYMDGTYIADRYVPLSGGDVITAGTVSFDLVISGDQVGDEFNTIISLDQAGSGRTSDNAPIVLYLRDGDISVSTRTGFHPTWLRFGANYRYHVDITFDSAAKKYSITIRQDWPSAAEPVIVTYENLPYHSTTVNIDSLMVVSTRMHNSSWVENLTVISTQ